MWKRKISMISCTANKRKYLPEDKTFETKSADQI